MLSTNNIKGIMLMIGSTIIFAIQDAFTKQISHIPGWQLVFFRFLCFSVFAIVYAWSTIGIKQSFRSKKPKLQICRSVLIVCEIALFAFSLRFLGLAEIHTVFASVPLIVTALSAPLLGEEIGWRRWLAVTTGFIGTVIILQPGLQSFNPYALLAVVGSVMMAIYTLLTRKVSNDDPLQTSLIYFGIVGFLFSSILLPFFWQDMSLHSIKLLILLCICSVLSHYLLIKALHLTPAVILQPFNYMVLIWAMALAYVFFGEALSAITLLGATIVVLSGLFVARREYIMYKKGNKKQLNTN